MASHHHHHGDSRGIMKKSTGKRIAELIHPHDDGLRVCGQRLRDGKLVAFPTETYVKKNARVHLTSS